MLSSVYVHHILWTSLSLFLSLSLSLCLSVCLSLYVSVCLSLYIFVCLYVSVSVSVCLCLSLYVSVCLFVYPSWSNSVPLSLSPPLLLSLFPPPSVTLPSLAHYLSFSLPPSSSSLNSLCILSFLPFPHTYLFQHFTSVLSRIFYSVLRMVLFPPCVSSLPVHSRPLLSHEETVTCG